MTVRIFVKVGFSDFVAYRYSSVCCFKCYCVYVCIEVVAFGSCKLLDIILCAILALNRQEIASVLACRTFCDYSVCQRSVCSRCICLCGNFTFSVRIDTECSTAYLFAGLCVYLVDNDIRIRLVLDIYSCYSIGLDLKVFAVLGNITDRFTCLDLCNLVITDTDITDCDCTLCIGSKSLIVALSGLGCACNTELPAGKYTVCTVLYNADSTRHCLVRKYFLYCAIRCYFKRNGVDREAVACCTAYFVHCVFFSCGKSACYEVICAFI